MDENQRPWIDAVYGNPIMQADRFPHYCSQQTSKSLLYTIDPFPPYEENVANYVEWVQRMKLPSCVRIVVAEGGSTQLVSAFYWAVSQMLQRDITASSSIAPPYYTLHSEAARLVKGVEWIDYPAQGDVLVIVSPNNPNGIVQSWNPTYSTSFVLLDSVYDREQFTNRPTVNEWKYDQYCSDRFCEINSYSKNGLAGARVGYALISNAILYEFMVTYIQLSSLGTGTVAFQTIFLNTPYPLLCHPFNRSLYATFQERHAKIRRLFPPDRILSQTTYAPFLFVSYPPALFETVRVRVRSGLAFATSALDSRISLMISDVDFSKMCKRIASLHLV